MSRITEPFVRALQDFVTRRLPWHPNGTPASVLGLSRFNPVKGGSMHHLFRTISKITRRTALLCLALPLVAQASLAQGGGRIIYPDPSLAKPQLRQALAKARAEHKRVIVEFGGNWCGDCQVLDLYFHDPANQ